MNKEIMNIKIINKEFNYLEIRLTTKLNKLFMTISVDVSDKKDVYFFISFYIDYLLHMQQWAWRLA